MIKKIVLIYILSCTININYLLAQTDVTNDTIRLECEPNPIGDEFVFEELDIKNNGATAYDFKVKKRIAAGDTVTGTSTFFCDDVCYGEGTYISPNKKTVSANSTFTTFSNHYKPNGLSGTSIIKYEFFNVNNFTQTVFVVFKITSKASPATNPSGPFIVNLALPSSVKEIPNTNLLSLYPNPANNKLVVSLSIDNLSNSLLKVYDLLGNKVIEKVSVGNNEKVELSTDILSNGIYYLKLEQENQVISTKKFVVAH